MRLHGTVSRKVEGREDQEGEPDTGYASRQAANGERADADAAAVRAAFINAPSSPSAISLMASVSFVSG